MDAYLGEELYDLITYCIQNPNVSDFKAKKQRIEEIGKELYTDGGVDATENISYKHYTQLVLGWLSGTPHDFWNITDVYLI